MPGTAETTRLSTSVTSPRLTDWIANPAGPVTSKGVKVGDTAAKVTTAYGALETFCCGTHVASVESGGGRLIVVVDDASQMVVNLTGGDPEFWSRSIAD